MAGEVAPQKVRKRKRVPKAKSDESQGQETGRGRALLRPRPLQVSSAEIQLHRIIYMFAFKNYI